MTITLSCVRCGGSITSENVAEVLDWNTTHDDVCPALNKPEEGMPTTCVRCGEQGVWTLNEALDHDEKCRKASKKRQRA